MALQTQIRSEEDYGIFLEKVISAKSLEVTHILQFNLVSGHLHFHTSQRILKKNNYHKIFGT